MSFFVTPLTFSILSGMAVSSPVLVGNAALTGLIIPALNANSAQSLRAEVAAAPDATSAQYVPLFLADRTGQWGISSTTGLIAVALSPDFHCFEAMRIVVSSVQSAQRDFQLIVRQL